MKKENIFDLNDFESRILSDEMLEQITGGLIDPQDIEKNQNDYTVKYTNSGY